MIDSNKSIKKITQAKHDSLKPYMTTPLSLDVLEVEDRPDILLLQIHNQGEQYPRYFQLSRKKFSEWMKDKAHQLGFDSDAD